MALWLRSLALRNRRRKSQSVCVRFVARRPAAIFPPFMDFVHGKPRPSLLADAFPQVVFLVQLINLHPNVAQALRVLKKKLEREGFFRELKRRKAYEKPSERRAREKGEAIRRGRKAARKLAQREGLITSPRIKRPAFGRR